MQSPFGVSEEGNAVSLSDTDSHSSETGSRGVPHGFRRQRCPACHWTGGVVGAAGIGLKGILQHMTESFELFVDFMYLSEVNASGLHLF